MEGIRLSEKQKELIEKLGVFMERTGASPAQSRVMALLLISDKIELTFDEIRETLQLSKSATSNAINSLLQVEKITYITKMGDRKRYFTSKIASQTTDFEKRFEQFLSMKEIYREILNNRTSETVEFNKKLARIIDFMDYMGESLPVLFEKWKKKES